MSSSQIASEAPHYNAVWGAFQPSLWTQYHGSGPLILSRYEIPFEDEALISGHNLAYFQQNHPDWILYGCQSNGTPTSDVAWSGSGFANDTPLNIHNPDVVSYEVNQLIAYMKANGYNALAVDQMVFENFLESPNPILGEGSPQAGSYGCGIYPSGPANGNFQRVYGSASGGDLDQRDPTFIQDELNWLQTAKTALSQNGMYLLVNHPPDGSSPDSNEQTMLNTVDGVVIENGFTNYGEYTSSGAPADFTTTLDWAQTVQSQYKKAVFLTYYFCQASCSNSASSLSGAQVDYALATYALANLGGADAYIVPDGVDSYSYRDEYANDNYGAACGGGITQNGSVYMEQFAHGLAIVNTGYSSQSVTLPSGISYFDIEQRATITNPMNVGATDGWMLLTNGNGCGSSTGSITRRR